jgi:hypothetical protein
MVAIHNPTSRLDYRWAWRELALLIFLGLMSFVLAKDDTQRNRGVIAVSKLNAGAVLENRGINVAKISVYVVLEDPFRRFLLDCSMCGP